MTATQTTGPRSPDAMTLLSDSRLAAQYAAGALILAMSDRPLRFVFASAAAAATFGGDDLRALNEALLNGGQPGGIRLAHLAQTIEADRPARLERLRFFLGGRTEVLDFECGKITRAGTEPLFVAVCGRVRPRTRRVGATDLVEMLAAEQPPSASGRPNRLAAESKSVVARRVFRFVWETDANHLATKLSADFTKLFGTGSGLVAGASFPGMARNLGADLDGNLETVLSRHETFDGVELLWPSGAADARIPVTLAGQPMFDGGRRFVGYRGFGVIRIHRDDAPSPTGDSADIMAASAASLASLATNDAAIDGPHADATNEPRVAETAVPAHSSPNRSMSLVDHLSETPVEVHAPETRRGKHEWDAGERELGTIDTGGDDMRAMRAEESIQTGGEQRHVGSDEAPPDGGPIAARPALSHSETDAFDELANLLQARLAEGLPNQSEDELETEPRRPAFDDPSSPLSPPALATPDGGLGTPAGALDDTPPPPRPAETDADIAAVMGRLPMGVLVTRGGEALYANRTLLELLGHIDLDAFHQAGGLDHTLRGRDPGSLGDADGGGSISLAAATGEILNVDGHMQAINWRGAPATLMSFRRSAEAEIARRVGGIRQELSTLENETAELHAILDTATDGVAVLDKSGIVLSLNRSAEALFGLEQADVIGEPFTNLLAPESHGTARDYLDGLKKSGVASVLNDGREVIGRAGRRGVIPLFMTLGRLPQRDEMRFCAVLRDLTPWKRAERDLQEARRAAERASQMKSDFLARVSHEIRTPMNAILGFAEVIVEERFGAVGNERYKEYLHDIHASGVHVMNIVNDLLDLSKIEAGKMELTFASVDANKIVAECVALMQPQAYRERVIIRMALAPRLPNVVADERSLRQIILNILANAVNFNEAGGQVIVSTALTDSGSAVLRIRDTGIGMNESDLVAALEPFRQLPTARKGTGTGLGLPLTKALADANRASFTIKSKKDEGTLVEIAFPAARVLTG